MRNYLGRYSIAFGYIVLISLLISCAENEDFENPLDPRNLRTSGSPLGLTLSPGDSRIVVSWSGAGLEGVTKYKVYRRFTGDPVPAFQLVGEIDFKLDPITGREVKVYEYIDESGLENDTVDAFDSQLYYVYRISYVDSDGKETPADINIDGIPEAQATPSLAPPPPEVMIGAPEDLSIKLIWSSYQPPDDIAGYRIYAGIVITGEQPQLTLLADKKIDPITGPTSGEQFYVDFAFQGDNVTKAYKVVAYDKFGVESASKVFQATSPNLPPATPRIRLKKYTFFLFKPTYQIDIRWDKNPEPDIKGYRLYTLNENGIWVTRKTFGKNTTSYSKSDERYIVVGDNIEPRLYSLVAFDKTPRREDGKIIDDESEPAIIEP
ncbi:TPA: hypothetical protein EYP66_04785 [Candidatus Poribacteria bacterium]|nr:hypothetical protein [Candidatus Poribacteria bacterium]